MSRESQRSQLPKCWFFHAPSKSPATRGSPAPVLVSAENV